jgi:flavin reductase (DIM6/NTAB) family NADH-FMN oxidoreductase RutF/DNA-binding MarR family transcriptional regulator
MDLQSRTGQRSPSSGEPAESLHLMYRRCLGQFATGVTVVTTSLDGVLYGVTANSFTSVSLEPQLILWAVGKKSRTYEAFKNAPHFAINMLSADQVEISRRFGSSKVEDKFAGIAWTPGFAGLPILDGTAATLECRQIRREPVSDHLLIIGEVVQFRHSNRPPLIFSQGGYAVAGEHPDVGIPISFRPPRMGGNTLDSVMSGLMYRAYASLSKALDEARSSLKLTHMEARLMTAIESRPSSTLDDLMPELLIGVSACRYTYDSLMERGLIRVDENGRLSLTCAGQSLFEDLMRRCDAVEAKLLASLAPSDIEAAKKLMVALIQNSAVQPAPGSNGP